MTVEALQQEAARWLQQAGSQKDVSDNTVRVYQENHFTRSFHGADKSRSQLGLDVGQLFRDHEYPDGRPARGTAGLVYERDTGGTLELVAEIYDLASGDSAVVAQPLRKTLFGRKAVGIAMPQSGPAPDLPARMTPPECRQLLRSLRTVAERVLSERRASLEASGLEPGYHLSRRGGDAEMWDCDVTVGHSKGQYLKSYPVWNNESPQTTSEEFASWLEGQFGIAGRELS